MLGTVYECPICRGPTKGCVLDQPCMNCDLKDSCTTCSGLGFKLGNSLKPCEACAGSGKKKAKTDEKRS